MLKSDPSVTPTVILNHAELGVLLKSANPSLNAFMMKVISTDPDSNTILRIYLYKSDEKIEVIPPGILYAICQIKTTTSQVIIDCLLSKDNVPLEPVWHSDYCEQMINKYRAMLHHEIVELATQTILTS